MDDYLTRLVERTLGLSPTARPGVPPTFTPKAGDLQLPESAEVPEPDAAGDHTTRRAPSRRLEPSERAEEDIPLAQRNEDDGPNLAERGNVPRSTTDGPARRTGTLFARTARSLGAKSAGDEREVREPSPEPEEYRQRPDTAVSEAPSSESSPGPDVTASLPPRREAPPDPTGSNRRAGSGLPNLQTSGREEDDRLPESSVSGAGRPSAESEASRGLIPEVPLVSIGDRPRTAPPTRSVAEPHEREAAKETPSPTVRITIGRVEVRAIPPEPVTMQPPTEARSEPALSLEDYLKQHSGGRR